jgi:cytochrome c biogenesis protein CcmG/thiol:disulfide interchange protein DsbE
MVNRRKPPRKIKRPYYILGMLMIGAGLLLLGVVTLVVLPKPEAAAGSNSGYSTIPMEVNYPSPELSLTDLQGLPVSLEDHLGNVVLVNNWATWCPPCKAEMPALQTFFDRHKNQDFTIVAIEAGDPIFEVEDFVKQYGLTFHVWPDPTQKATLAFRNPGLPSSYVIDQSGTVRLAWTGAINLDTLEKYVTPLLEE